MTLKLIETFKTSIYSPKNTKQTKIYFKTLIFQTFRKYICSKVQFPKIHRVMLILGAFLIFYVEGHTAQLVLEVVVSYSLHGPFPLIFSAFPDPRLLAFFFKRVLSAQGCLRDLGSVESLTFLFPCPCLFRMSLYVRPIVSWSQ